MPLMAIPKRINADELRHLSLNDFQTSALINKTLADRALDAISESSKTASLLRSDRDRFAKGIPARGNRLCYSVDRSAVLAVYEKALKRTNDSNHLEIMAEANLKIHTILGIRQAEPDDAVFVHKGMLLSPLEPQYAEPRLDFKNDRFQHKAAWRLKEWRNAGWPEQYPAEAIKVEQTEQGRFIEGPEGDLDLRQRMLLWDEEDWGY